MQLAKFLLLIFLVALSLGCGEINNELCISQENSDLHDFSGLKAYKNIDDAVACSVQMKLPIFILFTGYGCVSVRRTTFEEKLFSSRKLRSIIAAKFIPVVMYVDDRKKLEEPQIAIRNGMERKLRTVGNIHSDYQIQKFKQNSQPLFAILDHNGDQIISHMAYSEDSKQYYHFLKAGFEKYKMLIDQESKVIDN